MNRIQFPTLGRTTNETWCKPCLDRRRQRVATQMIDGEPWCESCFQGEGMGFELSGDPIGNPKQKEWSRRYQTSEQGKAKKRELARIYRERMRANA